MLRLIPRLKRNHRIEAALRLHFSLFLKLTPTAQQEKSQSECYSAKISGRVASPRRPRSAVGGLGTPVRSEIGPYEALENHVFNRG
jgi:hypothetical protein